MFFSLKNTRSRLMDRLVTATLTKASKGLDLNARMSE